MKPILPPSPSSAADPAIDAVAADWVARADAGLGAAEKRARAAWLAADPRHGVALARYESSWGALDRPLQTGAAEVVLRELAMRARRRRWSLALGSAVAAAIAVALWRPPAAPSVTQATAVVTAPERRVLPDGSMVELKRGADIAVDFRPAERRVTLVRGEAHFSVAKHPARPFVVTARGVAVRAVGTAFAVDLTREAVEVIVTEGKVALERPPAAPVPGVAAPPPVTLAVVEGGNRIIVEAVPLVAPAMPAAPAPGVAVEAVPPTELTERLAWRIPRLEFSGTPLAEAVELVNRHAAQPGRAAVRFVIDEPALAGVRVSGWLRADNTAGFIQMLRASFGVETEFRGAAEIGLRRAR
jgi:transmembrane sensor